LSVKVWRREEAPQLRHVAAPHVEPSPERHALHLDPRTNAMSEERHQYDIAGLRFVKIGRLGGSRVDCRHGQAFRDIAKGVRIADGEIVQPTLHAGIAANRKVRLVALHVERAAVHATDADAFVFRFTGGSSIAKSRSPAFDRHGLA
jgi:hypothetical protein